MYGNASARSCALTAALTASMGIGRGRRRSAGIVTPTREIGLQRAAGHE
jgi:hypothetical protein